MFSQQSRNYVQQQAEAEAKRRSEREQEARKLAQEAVSDGPDPKGRDSV